MDEVEQVIEYATTSPSQGVNLFLLLIICLFALASVIKNFEEVKNFFGIRTKFSLREEAQDEKIELMKEEIDLIKQEIAQLKEKLTQRDISCTLFETNVDDTLKSLQTNFEEMRNTQNEVNISKLRDRIVQAWHHFREKKCWDDFERQSFFAMVKAYTKCGGNSFVQERIVPEMELFEIIDD